MDDSNMVIVFDKVTEGQKAKDFAVLPKLKENMKKAGVIGVPIAYYADVIRNDDAKTELKDRVMVIHKVKDFNAWLKVYDGESMSTRKEHGLIDRGLARDMDDPNKVYLVFAISDMEKAKARIASEDLKKMMTDAGVEGPPQFLYYRVVD
jgi:quinol monooxygenase YgiN